MLETDLDIALSQGKTIDAREFAEQLILRGQPFRLAFMDGKRNTNIPDCVVLSIASPCGCTIPMMLSTTA